MAHFGIQGAFSDISNKHQQLGAQSFKYLPRGPRLQCQKRVPHTSSSPSTEANHCLPDVLVTVHPSGVASP